MGFTLLYPSYRQDAQLNERAQFSLFLAAALIIAFVPGPGIFYVAARTLSGGWKTGVASTLGPRLAGSCM